MKHFNRFFLPILFSSLVFLPISTIGQEYLRVYTSAPLVMTSNVAGGTLISETFESFSPVPANAWAPLPNGYNSDVGTYYQIAGQSYVKNDDQYGSGTGKYMSIKSGGKVKLTFDNPVRYFGFAWPAGDGQNTIKVIRNGQVIGVFTTNDVVNLLPKNQNNFITSVDGSQYTTYDYYGKPGTGQNNREPYAFLHFMASPGLAFDEFEFSMGAGGEFENDNHTILANGDPLLQGDWVELISIFPPEAFDDSGAGIPGQAVLVDVLDNDVAGTAPIVPSTVHIDGTNNPGDPLTVVGEGVWTVNSVDGKITFTPDAALVGSPTPIQYFVRDQNGFASNLATVTVTYPVGPKANDDSGTTVFNTPVDIDALDNDVPGSAALDPSTLTFVSGTEPDAATEGVFTVDNATGIVTFTPANNFIGTVSIDYQICDLNANCDIATITVEVIVGASNLYPAFGPGTLAYEDLWPAKGDYDFNDLVIDYQFEVLSNPSNYVDQVIATFTIKAFGASYENGFGFQLNPNIDADDLTVTGYDLTENMISLNANGTEAGQSKPTIIVFDNAYAQMPHPGVGIGVNTETNAPYVAPVTLTITIDFKPNTYTINDVAISSFNPFLIVNKDRTVEVHLPNYPPTDLADQNKFGIWDDDSDVGTGKYYLTANNLPWAINIYESFDYPIEKQDITWVHLKFAEWAVSGGVLYPNWYQNITGFRNTPLIYVPSGN